MLLYGTIHFAGRKSLGITNTEYLYLFCVMSLERNRNGGFCKVSDAEMSDNIGIARKNIIEMKKRLSGRGLLEVGKAGAVRVTDTFRDVCNASQQSISDYFSRDKDTPKEGAKQKQGKSKSNETLQGCNETLQDKKVTKRYSESNETLQESNETLHPVQYIVDSECTFLQYSTQPQKKGGDKNRETFSNEGKKVGSSVCFFQETEYFKGGAAGREKFEADLKGKGCPDNVDFDYYYNRLQVWSNKSSAKSKDWLKTALKFVQDDANQGHMATVQFVPIDQQVPQQSQQSQQHAAYSRRAGSARKNAIDPAQVLADVERIIADGW